MRAAPTVILCALGAGLAADAAHAEPACRASAVVRGDSSAARDVRQLLRERGLGELAGPRCPPLVAEVTRTRDRIQVTVTDADARRSSRLVTDTATAATIIESWSRVDLETALLRPRQAPASALPAPPPRIVVAGPRPPPVARRARPYSITGLGTVAYASDASLWVDAVALACAEYGPVCLGGLVRASFDSTELGASDRYETRRVAMDAVLMAELPARFGAVTISPGVGVGGGWMRSASDVEEAPDDTRTVDRGTLRFDAHVRVALQRRRPLGLELGVFADVAPLAHTARFTGDGVTLAGEPRWSLRAGLGVRYSDP